MEEVRDFLSMPVRDFIASVAAKTPAPGGGSVAGVVGAMGTALGQMALNFTQGKQKFAHYDSIYSHVRRRLIRARDMFLQLVADDVSAYSLYRQAAALADGDEKDQALQLALAAATNVPREMTKLTLAMMEDLLELADKCNPYLLSDLLAGAVLGVATVQLCHYNVRVNAPQLKDSAAAADIWSASLADLQKAQALQAAIQQSAGNQPL
jgi:formiminotetrahydrofolate cyclodeaminase